MARKQAPKKDRILSLANGWAVWRSIAASHGAQQAACETLAERGDHCAQVAAWHRQEYLRAAEWGTMQRDALISLTGGTF